jgi:nucleotide-binding universal stress UspA family protein
MGARLWRPPGRGFSLFCAFMSNGFKRIALAVAFSPTSQSLLAEAVRLARAFQSELLLIHVGEKTPLLEDRMRRLLESQGVDERQASIAWLSGDPARVIVNACRNAGVDLLIAGALKKEKLLHYYVGSIARKVLRSAGCSVLTIIDPLPEPRPWKNIVVNAEDSPFVELAVRTACQLGELVPGAWVHVVRELKLYGLTMAASDQFTEEEYEGARQRLIRQEIEKVETILGRIPHGSLKLNIKVVSGKSGFELPKFAERKKADLLVVGAPPRRHSILDRLFPHDIEYILADLPCSLLIVHQTHSHG